MQIFKLFTQLWVLIFLSFYSLMAYSSQPADCRKAALMVKDLQHPTPLLECLESYAKQQLMPNSEADNLRRYVLEDIFDKEEARINNDNQFERGLQRQQILSTPMQNQYRVRFPEQSRLAPENQILQGQCFDLRQLKGPLKTPKTDIRWPNRPSWATQDKGLQIVTFAEKMMAQIDEVSKFLANFHAITLGGESSLLFHPRQIKFCDQRLFRFSAIYGIQRRMLYFDRALHIAIPLDTPASRIKVLSASELMSMWNDGDQIRVVPKDFNYDLDQQSPTEVLADHFSTDLQERLYGFKRDGQSMALITELIAKYWNYLNPVGSIRSKARYFLTGLVHRSLQASPNQNAQSDSEKYHRAQFQFNQLIQEHQQSFSAGNIEFYKNNIQNDSRKLLTFYDLFLKKAQSPTRISQSIESSMSAQAKQDLGMILQLQHQSCFVGVTNNHTIITMIDFLMAHNDEQQLRFSNNPPQIVEFVVEKESSFLTTNMKLKFKGDSKHLANLQANMASQVSWVCTNTTDKVSSSLKLPTLSSSAYKAYTMNRLLDEVKQLGTEELLLLSR